MADNTRKRVVHIKSNVVQDGLPKLPASGDVEYGEIAVNYANDHETLSIRNSNDEIVPFSSDKKLKKINYNIPYIAPLSSSTASRLSAVTDELDTLVEGQSIIVHFNKTSATGGTNNISGCCLNLQLSDGTETGWKIIYYAGTTKLTTHCAAGSDYRLTYHENLTVGSTTGLTGWWVEGNYDSNTDVKAYYLYYYGVVKADSVTGIQSRNLAMVTSAGTWSSVCKNSATGNTSSAVTTGFLPHSPIIYYATGLTAGSIGTNTNGYVAIYSCNFRYSSNCANTLTKGLPVYFVGTINPTDGLFYLDENTWWTQTLPNSEDGKVYMYLGNAYDGSGLTLWTEHQIYEYKNGKIRQYQDDTIADSAYTLASSAITMIQTNERIVAEALNDLNDRIIEVSSTTIDLYSLTDSAYTLAESSITMLEQTEFVVAKALNELNDKILVLSASSTDNSVINAISAATVNNAIDISALSGSVIALSGKVENDEYVMSSALNDLNNRLTILSASSADNSVINAISAATVNNHNDILTLSGLVADISGNTSILDNLSGSVIELSASTVIMENTINNLSGVIIDNEEIVATAINDLNTRLNSVNSINNKITELSASTQANIEEFEFITAGLVNDLNDRIKNFEDNLVETITSGSTHNEYPTAKAVYDFVLSQLGPINQMLTLIISGTT